MLLSLIDLFFADRHCRNGRLKKARRSLDRVLQRNEENFDFLMAYDAFLMIREDRFVEARLRFEECVKNFSHRTSEDRRYILLFCEYFLSIYKSSGDTVKIRREAVKLDADSLTKIYLRFPSEEQAKELLV